MIAEHLHVSPILAVVAFAMAAAHYGPERQTARDRVHSYAIWEVAVFVLNVLAFLLMGLQARTILSRLDSSRLWEAIWFAVGILAVVTVVRIAWVLLGTFIPRLFQRHEVSPSTAFREAVLISWSGMRGLVTLATAFALPPTFPHRDLIVLTAFVVVLGSLIIQGLTVGVLIRLVRLKPDHSLDEEISRARSAMVEAALANLKERTSDAAAVVRAEYRRWERLPESLEPAGRDRARPRTHVRHRGAANPADQHAARPEDLDDAFHRLEEELDWAELHAATQEQMEMSDA